MYLYKNAFKFYRTWIKAIFFRKMLADHVGCKLNVNKTFGRRPLCLLNVIYTFNLPPVSRSNGGPRRAPIAIPFTQKLNLLLNVNNASLVPKFSKSEKSFLGIPLTKFSGYSKSLFMQYEQFHLMGCWLKKQSIS